MERERLNTREMHFIWTFALTLALGVFLGLTFAAWCFDGLAGIGDPIIVVLAIFALIVGMFIASGEVEMRRREGTRL